MNFKGIFSLFPHRRSSRLTRARPTLSPGGPSGLALPPQRGRAGPVPSWGGWISCTHPSPAGGTDVGRLWESQLGVSRVEPHRFPSRIDPGGSCRTRSQHELMLNMVLYADQATKSRTQVYPCFLWMFDDLMLSAPACPRSAP